MAVGSTQPLTKMNTRKISWGVKADGAQGSPYHLHVPSGNLEASTSWNIQGLSRFVQEFALTKWELGTLQIKLKKQENYIRDLIQAQQRNM